MFDTAEDEQGVLEVKCPFSARDLSVANFMKANPESFLEFADGHVVFKQSHNYFFQVQGQMAIAKQSWCDFVVWMLHDFTVERIGFEKEFWRRHVWNLTSFYFLYMIDG